MARQTPVSNGSEHDILIVIDERIAELDSELERLRQARALLSMTDGRVAAPRATTVKAKAAPKGRKRRSSETMAALGQEVVTYLGKQKDPISIQQVKKAFPAVKNGMEFQYLMKKYGDGAKLKKHGHRRDMTYSLA